MKKFLLLSVSVGIVNAGLPKANTFHVQTVGDLENVGTSTEVLTSEDNTDGLVED